ncbi:hypothetical protein ACROYT_G027416 [Oculina patagonica]
MNEAKLEAIIPHGTPYTILIQGITLSAHPLKNRIPQRKHGTEQTSTSSPTKEAYSQKYIAPGRKQSAQRGSTFLEAFY